MESSTSSYNVNIKSGKITMNARSITFSQDSTPCQIPVRSILHHRNYKSYLSGRIHDSSTLLDDGLATVESQLSEAVFPSQSSTVSTVRQVKYSTYYDANGKEKALLPKLRRSVAMSTDQYRIAKRRKRDAKDMDIILESQESRQYYQMASVNEHILQLQKQAAEQDRKKHTQVARRLKEDKRDLDGKKKAGLRLMQRRAMDNSVRGLIF